MSTGAVPPSGENPYAAPRTLRSVSGSLGSRYAPSEGVFRAGRYLALLPTATLPPRCLKCNAPAPVRVSQTLYWHTPWLYLLAVLCLWPYVLVALVVRRKVSLDLPLCELHATRRKSRMALVTFLIAGGIFTFFAGVSSKGWEAVGGLGFLAVLAGAFASLSVSIVVPRKIDPSVVVLSKVGERFLASLPPVPAHLSVR